MKARAGSIAIASLVAAAAAGAADAPRPSPRPVFEAQLDLVYVTVTVTDPAGKPVADLPDSAFEVREDGRPRPISVFSRGGGDFRGASAAPAVAARNPIAIAAGRAFTTGSPRRRRIPSRTGVPPATGGA